MIVLRPVFLVRNEHRREALAGLIAVKVGGILRARGIEVQERKMPFHYGAQIHAPEFKILGKTLRERFAELARRFRQTQKQSEADEALESATAILYPRFGEAFSSKIASDNPQALVYSFHNFLREKIGLDWEKRLGKLPKLKKFHEVEDVKAGECKVPVFRVTYPDDDSAGRHKENLHLIEIHSAKRRLWDSEETPKARFESPVSDVRKSVRQGLDLEFIARYIADVIEKQALE